MAKRTITGTVEEVKLVEERDYARRSAGSLYIPIKVKATVSTSEGMVYVSVQVCEHTHYDVGGGGHIECWQPSVTEERAHKSNAVSWTIPAEDKTQIAAWSNGALARDGGPPSLAVWRGDLITVEGSAEDKLSSKGNHYVTMNRAKLTSVVRD